MCADRSEMAGHTEVLSIRSDEFKFVDSVNRTTRFYLNNGQSMRANGNNAILLINIAELYYISNGDQANLIEKLIPKYLPLSAYQSTFLPVCMHAKIPFVLCRQEVSLFPPYNYN